MNIVVILAGGVGSRMKLDVPKQHMKVHSRQIIEYTLWAFSSVKLVDAILVVSNEKYIDQMSKLSGKYDKLKWVIPGGDTRIWSVYNAVDFLKDICKGEDKIIVTDAARPCVRHSETVRVLEALDTYQVVTTGVEIYETILRTEHEKISDIIQRNGVFRQTSPEGYHYAVLYDLYKNKEHEVIESYTNIGLEPVYNSNVEIGIVKTSPLNFKITTVEDIYLFETVIERGFEKYISDIYA